MPVPQLETVQPGTATAVVSTGTYEGARDGIEDGVCGTGRRLVKPISGDDLVNRA